MIRNKCDKCKQDYKDLTVIEDNHVLCKPCYDKCFDMLFKGQFTLAEVQAEESMLKIWNDYQIKVLRSLVILAKKNNADVYSYIETFINSENNYYLKNVFITREELMKNPRRHIIHLDNFINTEYNNLFDNVGVLNERMDRIYFLYNPKIDATGYVNS